MAKISSNILPTKVSARFLDFLQKNRSLRGAGRLYMVLSMKIGSKYHVDNAAETEILLQYFQKFQIKRWLLVLKEAGLVRIDRSGNVYLTTRKKFAPDLVDKNGRRLKERHVEVPARVLENHHLWLDFIASISMLDFTISMRQSSRMKKRSKGYAADQNPSGRLLFKGRLISPKELSVDSVMSQGVASKLYAEHCGVHKSTASRQRKRGSRFGHFFLARSFYPLETQITSGDVLGLRRFGKEFNGEKVVYVGGAYMEEAPAQIIVMQNPFFYA